jgi:hypothetical protein
VRHLLQPDKAAHEGLHLLGDRQLPVAGKQRVPSRGQNLPIYLLSYLLIVALLLLFGMLIAKRTDNGYFSLDGRFLELGPLIAHALHLVVHVVNALSEIHRVLLLSIHGRLFRPNGSLHFILFDGLDARVIRLEIRWTLVKLLDVLVVDFLRLLPIFSPATGYLFKLIR